MTPCAAPRAHLGRLGVRKGQPGRSPRVRGGRRSAQPLLQRRALPAGLTDWILLPQEDTGVSAEPAGKTGTEQRAQKNSLSGLPPENRGHDGPLERRQ